MKQRLDGLTGLRGITAFSVVIFHFNIMPLSSMEVATWLPFFKFGNTAVDIFFIISGFIISFVHLNDFKNLSSRGIGRFILLRLARIYPLYVLTVIFMVGMTAGAIMLHLPYNPKIADFGRLLDCLLMTQAWHSDGMVWNYPGWSLSAEWFEYLIFPLIASGVVGLGKKQGAFVLVVAAGALIAYGGLNYFESMPLIRSTAGFLLGMLCFQLTYLNLVKSIPFVPIALLAIAILTFTWGTIAGPLTLLMFYSIIVLACAYPGNRIERTFVYKPFEYLGQISYSLYLIHAPIQMVLGRILLQRWQFGQSKIADIIVSGAFIFVTVLLAHLVYRWFELPTRRWLRSRILPYYQLEEGAPPGVTSAKT
ncbi:acyltransferase family protein [Methylobacterium bullatum]|uniref:Acyltransferase 3 domain-containing protein n=1 Tax=Methylobacterium bullatum TaxID=570505 RepID=A0A679JDA5_9HYPH|nr:hypothetical protein MBLL_00313 [Methylobacterium bullatum]